MTLTATLSNLGGNNADGGSVTFYDGSTQLGPGTISNSVASYPTSTLPAGSHSFHAHYNGGTNLNPADSKTVSYTVNKATPGLLLDVKPEGGSTFGQQVTMTAIFSNLHGQSVDGEKAVDFYDGATKLNTSPVIILGTQAQFPTTQLAAGNHQLKACYNGDTNLSTVCSPLVTYTVGNQPTKTVLSIKPATTTVGSPVTLTATVTPSTTGTVYFCEAKAELCTDINRLGEAQLENGVATLKFYPGIGTSSLTAQFAGTVISAASTSPSQPLTVTGKYNTQTALGTPTGSDSYSVPVTVTGIVPPAVNLSPTGTVDIQDADNNSYQLGSVALTGAATIGMYLQSFQTLPVGKQPMSVTSGDFNANGHPDIAVANAGDKTVTVYPGQGNGSFATTPTATLHTPNAPSSVLAADFNNDGRLDVATGNGAEVSVFLANTTGGFGVAISKAFSDTSYTAYDMAIGDFDRNGVLDLAVTGNKADETGAVMVMLGDGSGSFTQKGDPIPTGKSTQSIGAGSFFSNGYADLIVANHDDGTVRILVSNSDGTFGAQPPMQVGNHPESLMVADFDGDGQSDFALGSNGGAGTNSLIQIYQGLGNGTFVNKPSLTLNMKNAEPRLAVGDFNADKYADIAVSFYSLDNASGDSDLQLWLGDSTFAFKASAEVTPGKAPMAITSADFDGDGIADLATANSGDNTATAALSQPTAAVDVTASNVEVPVGTDSHHVKGHYEGDANFNASDSPQVLLTAEKVQPKLELVPSPANGSESGAQVTLTATLTPYTSQNHGTDNESVTFWVGNLNLGSGSLKNGVAQTVTTKIPVGMNQITATYGGNEYFNNATGDAPYPYIVTGATKVALSISPPSTVSVGNEIILTATVTSSNTAVTQGTVLFCAGTKEICAGADILGTAQLSVKNNGQVKLPLLPGIGTQTYTARLLPSDIYLGSASQPASITVTGQYPTTNVVTASGNIGDYTIQATVKGIAPRRQTTATPSGPVDLNDEGNGNYTVASPVLAVPPGDFALIEQPAVTTGANPEAVASADFDGDGNPDLIVANANDKSVTLYLGNGAGAFAAPQGGSFPITLSDTPTAILADDFTNDGIMDFAVATGSTVTAYKGTGTMTYPSFIAGTPVNTQAPIASLVSGDFDGKGNEDIVATQSNTVTMLWGDGSGNFTIPQNGTVTPGSKNLKQSVAADFDGDGSLDVAATSYDSLKIVVLWGRAEGTFDPSAVFQTATSGNAEAISAADFDRDGNLDLVVGNTNSAAAGTVQLFQGAGQKRQFTAKPGWLLPKNVQVSVAATDLDGDGYPDIAAAYAGQLYARHNDGKWAFTQAATAKVQEPTYAMALADFNLDGVPDIAVANAGSNAITVTLTDDIYGLQVINAPSTPLTTGQMPGGIATGQLQCCQNAAALADIVVANEADNNVSLYHVKADGSFDGSAAPLQVDNLPYATVIADFNNDNINDVVVANGTIVSVFPNNGGSQFSPRQDSPAIPDSMTGRFIATGDFNRDGSLDLAITYAELDSQSTSNPSTTVLLGTGNGKFTAAPKGPVAIGGNALVVGDFDNNGKPDLAVANLGGGVSILLGQGDGGFASNPTTLAAGPITTSVALADFDGDGNTDVATGSAVGTPVMSVYQGLGDGVTFKQKVSNSNVAVSLVATGDFDGDNLTDLAIVDATNTLQLWRGDGLFDFRLSTKLAVGTGVGAIVLSDFNYDSVPDVATANANDGTLSIVLSEPTIAATATATGINIDGVLLPHLVFGHYAGDKNFGKSDSQPIPLLPQKLVTNLTLQPSPKGGSLTGQQVTLTATLTVTGDPQGHTVKGQNVIFKANGTQIGDPQPLSDLNKGAATATLTTTALPAGKLGLTAEYAGDAYFNGAVVAPAVPYTVTPTPVSTIIELKSVQGGAVDVGSAVTLQATVMAGKTPVKQGTVYFCNVNLKFSCTDINRLGEAQIGPDGTATLTFNPGLGVTGAYQYQAIFAGIDDATNNYLPSKSTPPLLMRVDGKYGTLTKLDQPTGNDTSYTAHVTGYIPPAVPPNTRRAPSGIVNILDTSNTDSKNYQLGSVQLPAALQAQDGLTADTVGPAAGKSPYSMTSGYFNADGIADMAIANRDGQSITVYLGTSDGQFQQPGVTLPTSNAPFPIVSGDFDNSGTTDLAFGNGSNLTVFPGDGQGNFNTTNGVNSPASDFSILVPGDFDRDGALDLAVVHSSNLQVYLGNGQNGFAPAPGNPVPPGNTSKYYAANAAAGDFNADGILDLAVPQGGWGSKLWILLGHGDGTFEQNPATISFGGGGAPESVALADFDGDGNLDLAAGVEYQSSDGAVALYMGDGSGTTFTSKGSATVKGTWENVTVAIGDFNADGIADLAAATYWTVYQYGSAFVQVWTGTGNWQFATQPFQFKPGGRPLSTVTADFNGDGFTDIGVANAVSSSATVGYMRPTTTVEATATNVLVPMGNPNNGPHQIEAVYGGDSINFLGSTSALVPVKPVLLGGTTFSLSVDPPQGPYTTSSILTFTAILTPSTGQDHSADGLNLVQFYNGDHLLGARNLAGGQATYITQPHDINTPPTANNFQAVYMGNNYFATVPSNIVPIIVSSDANQGASPGEKTP